MSEETSLELDIFADQRAEKFGESILTKAIRQRMAEIESEGKMTPEKQVLVALALEAAEAAQRGKGKGRAISGEVEQVRAILTELRDEEADQSGMTQETKDLIRALTIDPQTYAAAAQLHAPESRQAEPAPA